MHQHLSLHSSIPDSQLKITLHALASLSGMSPRHIYDHFLIFQPQNPFQPVLAAGQVNQIEQYRISAQCDLTLLPNENSHGSAIGYDENSEVLAKRNWNMIISEVPEAGKMKVTSQSLLTTKVIEGNPLNFLNSLGYIYNYEYWLKGYRFVMNDVVIELFRVCIKTNDTKIDPEVKIQNEEIEHDVEMKESEKIKKEDNEDSLGRLYRDLKLLEPSGRWTIKAYIDVKRLVDLEAIKSATNKLERLRNDLAGLFDLKMPDRNCFDTRVRR
jgi:mediator of RNA polymerase II transcription subunit 18